MKQLLLLLLLAGSSATTLAQSAAPAKAPARPAWQGGLLMGHDMFRVTNQRPLFIVGQYRVVPRITTPVDGFRIGFWTRYNFGPERRWLVQPEASYSRNQSWHRVRNLAAPASGSSPTLTDMSTVQDWQRLNLALPIGYRVGRRFMVLGGPVLSRRIPTAYERAELGYEQRIVSSINRSMRRTGLAWQAGVGMEMGRVLLTARYERSLLNVASDIELDGKEYPFEHFATQVSIGMALRLAPFRAEEAAK